MFISNDQTTKNGSIRPVSDESNNSQNSINTKTFNVVKPKINKFLKENLKIKTPRVQSTRNQPRSLKSEGNQ